MAKKTNRAAPKVPVTPKAATPLTWKTPPSATKTVTVGTPFVFETPVAEGGTAPIAVTHSPATVDTTAPATVDVTYTATDSATPAVTLQGKTTVTVKAAVPPPVNPTVTSSQVQAKNAHRILVEFNVEMMQEGDLKSKIVITRGTKTEHPTGITFNAKFMVMNLTKPAVAGETFKWTFKDDDNNIKLKSKAGVEFGTGDNAVTNNVPAAYVPMVIALAGHTENPAVMSIANGGTFTAPVATVTGGTTPGAVTHTGTVDTSVAGDVLVTYSCTDAVPNTVTKTLKVTVLAAVDHDKPVVTLKGSSTLTLHVGDTYTDPGATALDATDGVLVPVAAPATVDTSKVGKTNVVYTATDAAGNTGKATRIVDVIKKVTVPPVTGITQNQKDFTEGQLAIFSGSNKNVTNSSYDKGVDLVRSGQEDAQDDQAVFFDASAYDPYELEIIRNGIPN